jgi:hypothetical protein
MTVRPVAAAAPAHALGAGDCEAWRDGPVGQPTNTATSLGLVVAGTWVARRGHAVPPARRWWSAGYGALLAAAGIGSVAYHGRGGRASHWLHDLSLYALLAVTAAVEVHGFATAPPRRPRPPVTVGLVAAPLAYLLGRTSSPVCHPTSRWQWHGVWHLLVAATGAAWAEERLIRPGLAAAPDWTRP